MVEWKKIGDIIKYLPGGALKRDEVKDNGMYPVMNGGIDYSGYYHDYNYDEKVLTISHWGSSAGHVHRHYQKFWANNACWVFVPQKTSTYSLLYLYYVLNNAEKEMRQTICFGGATPNLNRALFEKKQIPIPSISEQQRIVEILDAFTDSIENLKQQIAQRRKQYEYYRDQLLDLKGKPNDDIVPFGSICKMIKGNGVQKSDFVEKGIGCIHYGQIYTHYGAFTYKTNKFVSEQCFEKAKKASKGDIIMTDTSENVEDICKSVAYLGEEDIAVSNHALIIKHEQDPKFLSFATLTKSFFLQKKKYAYGVKVIGIKPEHLANFKIYLPPLSEQQRIVSILDQFESSISNLEMQLAQRQKQYEYYRNKLLTFE